MRLLMKILLDNQMPGDNHNIYIFVGICVSKMYNVKNIESHLIILFS